MVKPKLTPEEREFVITGNESSKMVTIYTTSKRIMTKATKAGYKVAASDNYSKTFVTSENNITFRTEVKKERQKRTKVLTEDHIKKMQEGKKKKNG